MTLPNDVDRCDGELITRMPCIQRDTCQRYLSHQEESGLESKWYVYPQIPGPCDNYWEATPGTPRGVSQP